MIGTNTQVHSAAELDIVSELDHGRMPQQLIEGLGSLTRTMLATERVALIPTVSPMVAGHCIVFARAAFTNMLDFRREVAKAEADLVQTLELYEQTFGPSVRFEHGLPDSASTNCGVSRAHEHMVPASELDSHDVAIRISRYIGDPVVMSTEEYRHFKTSLSYLSLQAAGLGILVWTSAEIPSQTVRRAMAAQLGFADWDWKQLVGWNLMKGTIRRWDASVGVAREWI